jgi:hypothetical protein
MPNGVLLMTRNTKFQDVYNRLVAEPACDEALVYYGELLKKDPNMLFGKALDDIGPGLLTLNFWFYWLYGVMYEEFDQAVRDALILRITDPMMALRLCVNATAISVTDKAELESKFAGQLPKAEKEYDDGVLTPSATP